MNVPNAISIARVLAVPLMIWLIISGEFFVAFWVFILAGISDGVDGFIAKRFNQQTTLGAYLDPAADKLMLVSIYVAFGVLEILPPWLVILVVSRDVLIVGGVLLAILLEQPVKVRPLLLSKMNTAAQIVLAGVVLAALGFNIESSEILFIGSIVVTALTLSSGAQYVLTWIGQMTSNSKPRQEG
jgi:cardiolipin synthase